MKYYYILTHIRQSEKEYYITSFEASETPITVSSFLANNYGLSYDQDNEWYCDQTDEVLSNGCQIKEITAQEYTLLYKLRYGHEPADAKLEAMAANADEYLAGDELTTVTDIQRIIDHPNQLDWIDFIEGIAPCARFEYTFTCKDFINQIS